SGLLGLIAENSSGVMAAAGFIIGVILLYGWLEGMKNTLKDPGSGELFAVLCGLAGCGAVLIPLSGCIKNVCQACDSVSVFMLSFVPVYAGVSAAGGQIAAAASYQTVLMFVAQLISSVTIGVVLPLMTISLAISATGSMTNGVKLNGIGSLLNKSGMWLLGLLLTVFAGMLTLQTLVGAAADSVSNKAIKFSMGSFLPVIGGPIGEAFGTVKSCLGLLKTVIGGFGITATALIVLPPLIQCTLWLFCLNLTAAAAEMFDLDNLKNLLKSAGSVVKTLTGILISCALFMIMATTLVIITGS
ncbi:MAG: stage III sporulation protein AE, partial [Oscillospiraceae bacterium]|nr:stage III sporulation protein AE [Oscillospiraceae bacterium]